MVCMPTVFGEPRWAEKCCPKTFYQVTPVVILARVSVACFRRVAVAPALSALLPLRPPLPVDVPVTTFCTPKRVL